MNWTGRNTPNNKNCWRANTPEQVGPGAYQLVPSRPQRTSTAPFDSGEARLQPSTSQGSPGYYLGHKCWVSKSRCSSSFGSKAARMDSKDQRDQNPGPGSYELVQRSQSRTRGERHNPMQIEVQRTTPSIPTRETRPCNLGPGSYDPSYLDNKPATNSIGPGQYSSSVASSSKPNWMFNSSTKKNADLKIVKNEHPGPGSYEVDGGGGSSFTNANVGFGSNTKRDIPMSGDPYRPFVSKAYKSPPVGNYLSREEQEKIDKLKKKLITADFPVEKAPFGTSEKREYKASEDTPGPGAYEPTIDKPHNGTLPNRSPRFADSQSITPGPGTYKPLVPASQINQKFVSKSPRFQREIPKSSQSHEFYTKHKPWSIKQTRASDFAMIDKVLSFDTTGQRFSHERPAGPGPGQYDVVNKSGTSGSTRISGARSEAYGDYRPKTGTSKYVGPGAYESTDMHRKSFNMAKELGKGNVWL